MVKASESQIDNLVALLDGYAQEGGHHLNVNVFGTEKLIDAMEHPEKEESPRYLTFLEKEIFFRAVQLLNALD